MENFSRTIYLNYSFAPFPPFVIWCFGKGGEMMNHEEKINQIIKKLREENKVLPVTTDAVFKDLFQDESMKSILSYLISQIVGINYIHVFQNLVFRNTEHINKKALEKRKTSDLIVDIGDMVINLEMNSTDSEIIKIKNNFYHHNLAARLLKKGEKYEDSKKIIQINFNKIEKYDDRIIIKFMMRDEEGKYEIDKNYINYHINMAKIYEKYYNKEELSKFEKILLIMMLEDKEELKVVSEGDEELENMVRKIFEESEDPNVIGVYDVEEMNTWMMDVSKSLGKAEGQKEKSLEIAKNMLSMGIDIDTVVKVTKLSKEEVEGLK